VAIDRAQRVRSQAGYSVVELLTAVAIFGVLAAAGLPHLDTRREAIQGATQQVVADYRWTRARAITGGVHFAVRWTDRSTYQVERLRETDRGTWEIDDVVKQVALPPSMIRWGWPDSVEFDTRGMMISSPYATWQSIWDTQFDTLRLLTVWPSGQTQEYD